MSSSRMSPSYRTGYQKLGRVGKKIQKIVLRNFVAPSRARSALAPCGGCPRSIAAVVCMMLLGAFVAACSDHRAGKLQSGEVMAWDGLLGRWAGPVAPTDPSCGSTTDGLLSIGSDGFGFDPFQST